MQSSIYSYLQCAITAPILIEVLLKNEEFIISVLPSVWEMNKAAPEIEVF